MVDTFANEYFKFGYMYTNQSIRSSPGFLFWKHVTSQTTSIAYIKPYIAA